MHPLPSNRWRVAAWAVIVLLPGAAWIFAYLTFPSLSTGTIIFFMAAASLAAAIGGIRAGVLGIGLNAGALSGFAYLYEPGISRSNLGLWILLLSGVALMVGVAREKWSAAEMLAGMLRTDLSRLRDEMESQRSDLKRFHDLSVRLSSSLEVQRLLKDVLNSVATLQKTDLAMLLVLPNPGSRTLRLEAYLGFSADQVRLFGELPASFFSPERRMSIEDIDKPGAYFPFMRVAEETGIRAVFSTPIFNTRGESLGVVATFFRQPHAPGEAQSRLVELYARQAANALENARLYRSSLETLAAEQRRAAVLRSLAEASVQINSALTLDSLLQAITDQARAMIGARQAFTTLLPKGAWHQSMTCVSVAEGEEKINFPQESSEAFMLACSLNKPLRLPAGARGTGPLRSVINDDAVRSGWLAAPLVTRDGRNLGLIQLSQKLNGDFSEDDEAILVQLVHMASVAIDNVRLYREAQEQIAETRRAQEALQRSKESMQLAQQHVGVGIWEWDLQSGALEWSEEIRRLHGMGANDFDGKYEGWMESIHQEDRELVHRSITDAIARSGEYEVQYRAVFPDRSVHWLEARGRTIVIGGRPVRILGVAMDITSRKLAEDALRGSEKLAATGRLAASMAHEINNPLAAVTNALYILRTSPQLPKAALDYVKTAEAELARVVHITRQTLGFYRQISSPVLTSIPQLLDEVLAAYSNEIERSNVVMRRVYAEVAPIP
ncbi:MAG TPA: PAS domain-containing protein, partial [Terriglobales bacterium]|nr:PAS domain-containing protein [Terriglobales bacterium]